MRSFTLLATLLPLLTASAPLTLDPRAGGPIAKPIPTTCHIDDPFPNNPSDYNDRTYKPSPAFITAHILYQAYFSAPPPATEPAHQCLEQCYGYGTIGTCKSAFLAHNVPTPKGWENTEGGALETACLLFDTWLTPKDFAEVEVEGRYVDATAGSIYCPN